MFDTYCLFIYFLCCKYRPFFPIFFYIIPTKICKILFFCKNPLFPSAFAPSLPLLYPSFAPPLPPLYPSFPPSFPSLYALLFPFFRPLFAFFFPFCIQGVGFGAARLHRFPSSLSSIPSPSSLIIPLSFGEWLGVRLLEASYFKLNLCDCSICLGSSASSSSSLVMIPCSITIS